MQFKTCAAVLFILNISITVSVYLQGGHPQLLTTPALSDLRQVVDEPLKDVSGIQVTVIVHVDVDHALSI